MPRSPYSVTLPHLLTQSHLDSSSLSARLVPSTGYLPGQRLGRRQGRRRWLGRGHPEEDCEIVGSKERQYFDWGRGRRSGGSSPRCLCCLLSISVGVTWSENVGREEHRHFCYTRRAPTFVIETTFDAALPDMLTKRRTSSP